MTDVTNTKTDITNTKDVKEEIIKIDQQLSKDDLQFQRMLFAQLAGLIKRDLNSNQQANYSFHKNYNKEDVIKWQANPRRYEKQLRNLSRFLYDTSSHYKRLTQYFATMLTFDYIIEPYGMTDFEPSEKLIKDVKRKYIDTANFLEVMNIKHEFLKVCECAWMDDVSYFYEYQLKDSYFLMNLDSDYCAITGILDGCLTYSFDFSYFKKYPEELDRYSDEFKQKYKLYQSNSRDFRWQEIDPSKSLCIKINENIDYPIPPFCGLFEEIYSIEDYKSLKLTRSEMENYLLLVAKIPFLKDAGIANNFGIELNLAKDYFNLAMDAMPPAVAGMLSPFDSVEAIKVSRNDKNTDYVSEAQQSLYDSAGVSQLLFNSTGTGAAITKSILVDESVAFKVLRQFERWINKKLKDVNKVIKFRVQFLDITRYSQNDYLKNLKESASLGLPIKLKYNAALGQSPSSALHMEFLENSVLDLVNQWKPLSSSFQTNLNDKGGNPGVSEDKLSPEGQITKDRDDNNPDNRV